MTGRGGRVKIRALRSRNWAVNSVVEYDIHTVGAVGSNPTQPTTPSLAMRTFTDIIERDPATGLLVGYVPGFPGAHSQAATLDELNRNLREVIEMLLEDGDPSRRS